jgi:hypothetical protein
VPLAPKASVESLSPPTITGVAAVFDSAGDGSGVRLSVTLANPGRADVDLALRWKPASGVAHVETSYPGPFPVTGAIVLETGFVTANTTLDVEARMLSSVAQSDWSSPPVTVDTSVYTTAPGVASLLQEVSWGASLNLNLLQTERSSSYVWEIYTAGGVTLLNTITTTLPSLSYSAVQAAIDAVAAHLTPAIPQRAYRVVVTPQNAAGAGTAATLDVTKPAPAAITGVTAPGTPFSTDVEIDFVTTGALGYYVAFADTAGFNPATYGFNKKVGDSPAILTGLGAHTYYAKVAAIDEWSSAPAGLNFSTEITFVVTPGGGGSVPAGGGGGPGGAGDGLAFSVL